MKVKKREYIADGKRFGVMIYGDAFDVMEKLQDKSIDLIITSPPFMEKEVEGDYWEFFDRFVQEANRISNITLVFNSSRHLVKMCEKYGEKIKAILIWDKVFTLPAFKYEPIFVFADGEKIWGRGRIYRDVLRYRVPMGKAKFHINENPVVLYEELLRFFPNSQIILDPFAGSGTTAIACIRRDHEFIVADNDMQCIGIMDHRIKDEIANE